MSLFCMGPLIATSAGPAGKPALSRSVVTAPRLASARITVVTPMVAPEDAE